MIPYVHIDAIEIGPIHFQPFGILVATGVAIGYMLAIRRGRQAGLDLQPLKAFIVWILVGGFIGAHVLGSIFYHPDKLLQNPWFLIEISNGLSSVGGFIGSALGAFAWKHYEMREAVRIGDYFALVRPVRRKAPVPILRYADTILSVFPVAWIFGRAGCAIAHDHPGVRATKDALLAVAYGPGPVEKFGLLQIRYGIEPRYDLGFLEMLFAIVLAAVFALNWSRPHKSGWYVWVTCLLYAPVRFVLDFLRIQNATDGDVRYGGLTPAQWACCGLFVLGIGIAWRLNLRSNQSRQTKG